MDAQTERFSTTATAGEEHLAESYERGKKIAPRVGREMPKQLNDGEKANPTGLSSVDDTGTFSPPVTPTPAVSAETVVSDINDTYRAAKSQGQRGKITPRMGRKTAAWVRTQKNKG